MHIWPASILCVSYTRGSTALKQAVARATTSLCGTGWGGDGMRAIGGWKYSVMAATLGFATSCLVG